MFNTFEIYSSAVITAEQRGAYQPTIHNKFARALLQHQIFDLMTQAVPDWEEIRADMTPNMERMFRFGFTIGVLENTMRAAQEANIGVGRRGKLADAITLLTTTERDLNQILYGEATGFLITSNYRLTQGLQYSTGILLELPGHPQQNTRLLPSPRQ